MSMAAVNPVQAPARILIVEDHPANLELMVDLFDAFGYAPRTARDGESGVQIARAQLPDLIVCDVHLPKLDGYGVVKALKQDSRLKSVPIIAVTALAMVGDRDKMLAAGFDGYISKPIAPETFVSQVEEFLPAELRTQGPRLFLAEAGEPVMELRGSKRGTVLVVDDTPANIEFARSTLEPSGYDVLSAANVADAITIAQTHPIDLLLSDLHMRGRGGRELLAILPAIPGCEHVPRVIISSTCLDEIESSQCLVEGATLFILRPIEPETLLAKIDVLLNPETASLP